MAVGWVQDWTGIASVSPATITGAALTANNWVAFGVLAATGVTITPPAGVTSVLSVDDTIDKLEVFIFKAVGGETSFAFTLSSSAARVTMTEFSAILDTSPTDVSASTNTASGTSCSTGTTAATAQADEMAIAFLGVAAAVTSPSCATGFTVGSTAIAGTIRTVIAWKVLSATGTQAGTWSWTTSRTSTSAIVCLKGLAAGGGGTAMWTPQSSFARKPRRAE